MRPAIVCVPFRRARYCHERIGISLPFQWPHRGTESLGYLVEEEARRALVADRLDALGVPAGPERSELAGGSPVVLADGRRIIAEMVQGSNTTRAKLAIVEMSRRANR